MNLTKEVNKPKMEGEIVVYAGRFQPFHKGHYDAYKRLVDKFGSANVYIATSNDTSSAKSPFSFKEKKEIATKMFGVPSTKFVKVNNPYRPVEILKQYDGKTIAYIAAVGEKDATRLQGKYFKPYKGKAGYGYDEIGYTYPIPAEQNPISGTDVRNNLGSGDMEKAKRFFLKAYPKFDKDIFKMITTKLNEGLGGGIGVGLNLPGGYINGAPTGSVDESNNTKPSYEMRPEPHPTRHETEHPSDEPDWHKKNDPYDPIAELIGRVVTEHDFNEFINEYLGEESEAEKMGLKHLGGGYYGKDDKGPATHKSDNGKIRALTPDEIETEKQKQMVKGPSDAPVNKGDTEKGKIDKQKEEPKSAEEKPAEQAPPPEQKLSGTELKSSAEKSDSDKKSEKVSKVLQDVRSKLSAEENQTIDNVNNPQSNERKGMMNNIKSGIKSFGKGLKHWAEHKKEMVGGTMDAVKALANGQKIGSVKNKETGKWEYSDETRKKQIHHIKHLAFDTGLILGSMALGGAGVGVAKAVMSGKIAAAGGAALQGATGAFTHGVGGFGAHLAKDIAKHATLESLGLGATHAAGAGAGLSTATMGLLEITNVNDSDKFLNNLFGKIFKMMETYKMNDEQLLKSIQSYQKNKPVAIASDLLKENLSETKQQSIQHFVEFATKRLKLKEQPKINLVGGREFAEVKTSLGGFDPLTKEIFVATEGRLTADILRTLAHEMVHRKQDELGLVRNAEKDGADGSPIENQAHAVAGILMREYGRINKQIYNEGFVGNAQKEMVTSLIKAKDNFETALKYTKSTQEKNVILKQLKDIDKIIKSLVSAKSLSEIQKILDNINIDVDKGDIVLMGKFKNKKTTVKDIGTDDHGMPTINGKQATTFRKIDEMGNKDIHFMNIIKLYRNSTFRKRINAYLFGRANMTPNPNMVAKELRNMGYDEITQMEKELNIQPNLNESLLLEGGAYGHMSHPFDDMDLTFGDLKNIITMALNGELGVVREKTDGQALAISWKNGRLIAARNKSHLANAGANALGIEGIASKFNGRGGLTDAYNFAMKDLTSAISSLSQKQREKIFGEGTNFMNLEVIWPTSVNVIPYGQALLVFHNCIKYDTSGNAVGQVDGAESILAGMIKQVNADVQSKYTIQGPPITSIPKSEDLSSKQSKYLSRLNKLQNEFGLKDSDNVADYHQSWWDWWITSNSPVKVDKLTKESLIRRWAFGDKSFRLNTISNEELQKWAIQNDKVNVAKQQKENIKPFEELFLGVGADVLEFVGSVLTVHPDKAIRTMKEKFKSVASQVRSGGDPTKIAKLKQELQRLNQLGGIDRIVASEGLVFFYNGKTYKLTGTFAPLNQILGIFYA